MNQLINTLKKIQRKAKSIYHFPVSRQHHYYILAPLSILGILIIYLWWASFGLWTEFPTITTYYDKLATAFQHGRLSLDEKPDPALVALPNPYNPAERSGIRVPTDYSLYNGKYYLYFGAVPALFLTIAKLLGFGTIGDQYPVFVFTCGVFVAQSLLIIFIWKYFFSDIPVWMMTVSIALSGLISPFLWILTRARFYEAASTSGQFFFLIGIYSVITAYAKETVSNKRMLLGGIAWAFALGARLIQILPICFSALMIIFLALRSHAQRKARFSTLLIPLIWLSAPVVIGASIIGWYNWARFGSVFETGFYYELAGPYLQKYSHQLFSPIYLLPNLYNYLLMKPSIIDSFPLLRSAGGIGATKFPFITLPPIYFAWDLTGMFYSTPFVLFASFLALPNKKAGKYTFGENCVPFTWIIIVLTGIFFLQFIPFILYFWVETRFYMDFMPPLVILAIMGFWKGYSYFGNAPLYRNLFTMLGISLIVVSILMSILLAFGAHRGAFKEFNPVLWKALYKDFRPLVWKNLYYILSAH